MCPPGKTYSNCTTVCNTTCQTLTCSNVCSERDSCIPGCVCPIGTVENNNGDCVNPNECDCFYNQNTMNNNEFITDPINCKTM